MELIQSFTVDHTKIVPGIYVSRIDTMGDQTVTTYDVRVRKPNVESAIDVAAMHSLEHIIATYLRNDPEWKDRIIYWGPMGCLTGNYLLLRGDYTSKDIVELMKRTFRFVADFEGEIPGAAAKDCGNYLLHDLPMARLEARKYLEEVLEQITEANLVYP